MSYQRPIFHDDGYGRYLLKNSERFLNVHQNWAGDYYFSPAYSYRASAEGAQLGNMRKGTPALYRIRVRLKAPA